VRTQAGCVEQVRARIPEEGVLAMQASEPLMRKSDDVLAGLRLA